MPGLNLEQSAFNGCGATETPKKTCQSENEFSFGRRLRVVVRRDAHFECRIIICIFECIDNGFCREPMADGIPARLHLAIFGHRSAAETSVTAVGVDLSESCHDHLPEENWLRFVILVAGCSPQRVYAEGATLGWLMHHKARADCSGSKPILDHQSTSFPARCSSR